MDNSFVCGSLAGLITCTIVQPLDVVKTTIITVNNSLSIPKSISYVKRQYGVAGFWRGLRPASYKAIIGSGISFYYLELLKSLVPQNYTGFFSNSIVGMVARGLSIISLSPLSIIKVRMEAPQTSGYTSVSDGMVKIFKQEGIKGYYKGLPSCLMRDLPFSGLSYGFYQLFSDLIASLCGNNTPDKYNRFTAAVCAGMTATLLTQPFDIIKIRQQFSHISGIQNHEYNGIFDAIRKIYINEGIKGFTIGFNIRIIERSSGFALVWFLYENFKIFSKGT